eukprot:Filipodium_phascolosomae@DN1788_c0_g1_i1.p1
MADTESQFSLTTFSPTGKLVQIEHAINAVLAGKPALGIKARNGVVIASEKKVASALVDETTIHKIERITSNIGCTFSGVVPDFRVVVARARKQALAYSLVYNECIPVAQIAREMGIIMQEFTQSGGVRPFGVSLLVAGYDEDGPQLYQVDPSGTYFAWKASAIGKNMINGKSFLEKRYSDGMELEDVVHTALLTLKEGFEGAMNETNVEIGMVGEDLNFRLLTPAEVKGYLSEVAFPYATSKMVTGL